MRLIKKHPGGIPVPIVKIDELGNILDKYSSIDDAAEQNHVSTKFVWARCNGIIRKEYSLGFSFRYAD